MSDRSLMILAGAPGAGKSCLLQRALREDLPLFGPAFEADFRGTAAPPVFPEESLSVEERTQAGTWFSAWQVPQLIALRHAPKALVLHLDLAAFQRVLQNVHPLPASLQGLLPRSAHGLHDEHANEAIFRYLLPLLFRSFARIAITTLHVPYPTACEQWLARDRLRQPPQEAVWPNFLRETLYNRGNGVRSYEALYDSWFRALDCLPLQSDLICHMHDGQAEITANPFPAGER